MDMTELNKKFLDEILKLDIKESEKKIIKAIFELKVLQCRIPSMEDYDKIFEKVLGD